jgi:hypothetical protein
MMLCRKNVAAAVSAVRRMIASGATPQAFDTNAATTEKLLGRFNLETMSGMAGWQPPRKLLKIIEELQREGRL